MIRTAALALALAFSPVLAPESRSASPDAFAQLVADYEAFLDERDLNARARRGDLEAAARWPDAGFEAVESWDAAMADFYARLAEIDASALTGTDVASHAVLSYTLRTAVELPRARTAMTPFTNDSGFHTSPDFAAMGARVRTVEEAEAWIARIRALPGFFAQHRAWMERGMQTGFTQPREILDGVADQIEAQITPAADSALMMPIDALPSSLPGAERARLREEALEAIETAALPALRALHDFFVSTYIPNARETLGARDLPDGEDFYPALVRQHTTLDLTPEDIHQTGLEEVERIRAEMETVIADTGFEGSFAEFLEYLRTDPKFYAQSEMELMMRAAWLSKQADDQMPAFFNRLPRLPYGVRPVPAAIAPNYTTGRYWSGDPETGRAGGYMVNTYRLDQRPLYELPALTLHEAVPGHHHQIALAQEIEGLPDFRRRGYITAFGEGWGLYSEYLGLDMGFYQDPYENFGRLTFEMWRACRLVVDTGIHWFGWTREQAEACFLENSALAPLNITNEVSRYISWPGQALAYKTGEILIRRLRAQGEAELGEAFDLAAFHDALLEEGAVPLDYLEARMEAWLAEQGG
ncbi:DUF885 domain-containing protein [Alkalicaulis satelles]|uniref:DUF885 domain-containing protein n=1 Tax=Alkalicaulis satelles TaxID=2609175 RepID=A0A5M6ZHY5_9PROT|nr:DUF885 domain-containing protein [Alkalicaulis satelles]KAA5803414.1 DUF885 domain-containing protein [Alkalicaulis satelles]